MKGSGARYVRVIFANTPAHELFILFTILGSVSEPCPDP